MSGQGLREAVRRMARTGQPELAIRAFEAAYRRLESAETGLIAEADIAPLDELPRLEDLDVDASGAQSALAATVVIRLNGGLGTSMGVDGPKTALPVRDGLTFLDVMARQVLDQRARHGVELPLVLMNSFRTREESLRLLSAHPDLAVAGLPQDFLQHAEPKLRADDLSPVTWPEDPELEWCPPGHGDLYVALQTTGLLDRLRARGFRYAFASNADNLGATCDPAIPAWMAAEGIPYVAEVCDRTLNDRKGGHLAVRRGDGQLVLRDNAQVADEDMDHFQDVARHRYFHANNVWMDLDVLASVLAERDGLLGLPLIVNRKTVDPTRPDSTPVVQLESSMGSAIAVLPGARALHVPRRRFRPVKTTNELLLVRSDLYALDAHHMVVATTDRPDPAVRLSEHYRLIGDFEARFPFGVPSLRRATSFTVRGDVTFGADVVCAGDVTVSASAPRQVADGALLSGDC
jgi:UTP--glucose-1-phosphate uridylyltransferase